MNGNALNGATPIGGVCLYLGEAACVASTANPVWAANAAPSGTDAGTDDPGTLLEALGWMVCDGRALECNKYPQLYAVLRNRYGGDPDQGVFRLPDLRGLFVRGVDHGAGADPDAGQRQRPTGDGSSAGVGSIQWDALQVHQHTYSEPVESTVSGNTAKACNLPTRSESTSDPVSARISADETRARNMAVHYIIRCF